MMSSNRNLPLVTVVTPCLNMGGFIARTVESVLSQDYENLEYIVVDGGSSDGTLDLLRSFQEKYPHRLHVLTGPDGGAAEALQKGLKCASGEIFAYLNADDTYFPGAIRTAVHWLLEKPEAAAVYGNAYWIDVSDGRIANYPTEPFNREALKEHCYICQPACFVRTSVLRAAGGFDAHYQVAFDYELWLRLSREHQFFRIDALLANSRMHKKNKTFQFRSQGFREASRALREHYGYVPFRWAHTYAAFLLDRRDQFFEPLRPSFTKFVFSLVIGTLLNWRSPWRFWREWRSVMSVSAFVRRWNDTWFARRLGILIR